MRLIFSAEFGGSIGIVTPFRGQVNLIRKLVAADEALEEVVANREILVETAHRFQGDERDVMIFSPVLAEGISEGAVRFLRNTPNLFNVAVTRARAMLVVVGDRKVFSNQEGHLGEFEAYVRRVEEVDRVTAGNGDIVDESNTSRWVRLFREALGNAGIDAVPNYFSDGDVMCLAVMSGGRRLDIEVDHDLYHRKWIPEQIRRDLSRTERLHALGWNVKRFWIYQLRDDLEFCVASVKGWHDDTEHVRK